MKSTHHLWPLLSIMACTAGTKRPFVDLTMRPPETRIETFEATLRVLDDHPEYVDEFYVLARRHRVTFERFIENTASDLTHERLSKLVAAHLAANPASLRKILVETIDASDGDPDAREAITEAIRARVSTTAGIITDDPKLVAQTVEATIDWVLKRKAAQRAFVGAMEVNAPELARILSEHPEEFGSMIASILEHGGDDLTEALMQALEETISDRPSSS